MRLTQRIFENLDPLANVSLEEYVKCLQGLSERGRIKAQAILAAGLTDGNPLDEKMSVSVARLAVNDLLPSQSDIGVRSSLKHIMTDRWGQLADILSGEIELDLPLITYNSKWVVDGHHRWAMIYCANPQAVITNVDNIHGSLSPQSILKVVHAAIFADTGDTFTKEVRGGDGDLLELSDGEIFSFVVQELSEEALVTWSSVAGLGTREAIAERIVENVEAMRKFNAPKNWAGARDFMPQPVESGALNWLDMMVDGKVNFLDPKPEDVAQGLGESLSKIIFGDF